MSVKGFYLRRALNSRRIALILVAIFLAGSSASHIAATVPEASIGPYHAAASQSPPSDDWPTYHRDMLRSGYDPVIQQFTSVSLNWRSTTLDGDVYAEPLIVGTDVVVATEDNSLYELSATTGQILWHMNLGSPVNGAALPCGDISPSGITGTPVIDVPGRTIYVVAFLQSPSLHHELFAVDLDSGNVKFQLTIDPSSPNFTATDQQQRGALALANGYVYVPYGGLDGDCGHYHGWIAAINMNGGGPVISYQVPTGNAGAIWGGGDGPVVDQSGDLLVATGNSFSATKFDFGDAVIRLSAATSPPISVLDWFAPTNWSQLNTEDLDLGSTEPATISASDLFQIGKEGVGYLLSATSLGHIGGQLFSSQVCDSGHGAYGGLAYSSPYLIVPCNDGVVALQVNLESNPPFTVAWRGPNFLAGPPIIAGNAVWTVDVSDGKVYALSLTSGTTLFTDTIGSVPTHFNSLSAADGQIFVPANREITAYLPTSVPSSFGTTTSNVYASSTSLGFEETGNTFDNSGAGFMIAHRTGAKTVFVFTDSTRVDSTGELSFAPDYGNAVVIAGPAANPTTAFYEKNGFTPLTASVSGGNVLFQQQGGSTVFTVSLASLSSTNDYFLMEAFQDVGHTVIILYGINAPGTLASGVYFDANFASFNAANYPSSAYIVHWQGTTPNTPLPSDTYTIVYHN